MRRVKKVSLSRVLQGFSPPLFHRCSRVLSNRPHFPWVYRRDNPRRITSRRRAIYKLYECSPNITHIHQHMIRLPRACRGRTALRFPANSPYMCRVQLAHKRVLCTRLGSRGSLRHGFSPFMLMNPNKRQTAIHGCFFLRYMALRMRSWCICASRLHYFQGNVRLYNRFINYCDS